MSYQSGYGFNSFGIGMKPTPMVKRLLIANAVVFGLQLVLTRQLMFDWFAFQPRQIVFRPWGPITYMFLHGDLMHLAGNMLFLFFFGPPLEGKWGEREFLKFYLICGLGGVALSIVFLPTTIVGASAAVYGVMLAFAMNWPNAPIYVFGIFPVLAKYLVAFMGVLNLLGATNSVQGGGSVAHFAHLGGLLAGYLYLKADWRTSKPLEGLRKAARNRGRRLAIVPGDEAGVEEAAAAPRRPKVLREEAALYDRVDAVLDKISAEGMSSLTAAELELLDHVSKKHRTN